MINTPEGKRGRGRPKKSLDEVIREDMKIVGLTDDLVQDRRFWRDKIKILDRRESTRSGLLVAVAFSYVVFVCRLYFLLGSDSICLPLIAKVCCLPLFLRLIASATCPFNLS